MPKGKRRGDSSRRNKGNESNPKPSSLTPSSSTCFAHIDEQYLFSDSQLAVHVGEIFDHVFKGFNKSWMGTVAVTAFGFFISSGLSLLTSDFRPVLFLDAVTVRNVVRWATGIFLVLAIGFGISEVVYLIRNHKYRDRAAVVAWGTNQFKKGCTTSNTVSLTPLK